ncbi:hypothetical protein THAOC_10780, partial [Thalassiosira oceanica]
AHFGSAESGHSAERKDRKGTTRLETGEVEVIEVAVGRKAREWREPTQQPKPSTLSMPPPRRRRNIGPHSSKVDTTVSSGAFLVAVWCVAVATGQEQCRFKTGTMADQSPGDCNLDELPTAELEQICARTGFDEAMASIRRRQRDDSTPNRADLTVEAQKCLMLDGIRSSKPKKWIRDILSLSYEQYSLFSLENKDTRRHAFLSIFVNWAFRQVAHRSKHRTLSPEEEQDLAQKWSTKRDILYDYAVMLFSYSDEEMPDIARDFKSSTLMPDMNPAQEAYVYKEIYKNVGLIKLDGTDEKNLLWMLSYLDPNALDRLISGDIPDLKRMQPRKTMDWIALYLGTIALGCVLLLKRNRLVSRNSGEKNEEGQRVRGGVKKKGRRKNDAEEEA